MKKLFLFLILSLFISGVYSQEIQFGAMAGINVSGASAKEPGVVFHGTPLIRYALGGFADMALPDKRFSIRPSLLYSREAYQPDLFGDKTTVRISYIILDIPAIYHSELLEKRMFFGLGPYLGYALTGNYTNRGETTKIVWGSDPNKDDGKRLDIGLDLAVGYELQKNIILTAKFDLGLKNIATERDVKVHTRNFGLTCGYVLGKK